MQISCVTVYFAKKPIVRWSEGIHSSKELWNHHSPTYKLDESVMSANFTCALTDPFRTFFLDNLSYWITFDDIETFMLAEFSSMSCQLQVGRKLETITLSSFMTEKGITWGQDWLMQVVFTIDTLVKIMRFNRNKTISTRMIRDWNLTRTLKSRMNVMLNSSLTMYRSRSSRPHSIAQFEQSKNFTLTSK